MRDLTTASFRSFFEETYGYEPFPWQWRLAERVCTGDWPSCIALPTAAGKTTCIDIAIFAMAYQFQKSGVDRTAPRRVFFVVDRRVVVDQVYEHAKSLARKLAGAKNDTVREVSTLLKRIAGCDCTSDCKCRPLDYYALRGGMYRESVWVRSPRQPTIITSTVDQVGSRLLFRGYGVSDAAKPLHAALVCNDALIFLDEAHCSKPFGQTISSIQRYRTWADQRLRSPFQFVSITATPSPSISDDRIERDNEEDRDHPVLGPRIRCKKPATLVVADKARGKSWDSWGPPLVERLAKEARGFRELGFSAIGVIVNRVATARQLAKELCFADLQRASKKKASARVVSSDVEVILLTGRMRPMDRDGVLKRLEPLFSGSSAELEKPTYVVATQCLEVGADLDFHALVTECASLDALRQRFGRLNRIATREAAGAVVVVRGDQVEPSVDDKAVDPIYGNSLSETWKWLKQNATDNVFDFGAAVLQERTRGMTIEELEKLNAPSPDAAVLLPDYLDIWCQSNPIPAPDPDPTPFLHGPTQGAPDVQIVFRSDLGVDDSLWAEIVSLCPPSSPEALPVRIDVFRRWLANDGSVDESGDLEGEPNQADVPADSSHRRALCWCGPDSDRTRVIRSPEQAAPGDTFILRIPECPDHENLGDFPGDQLTDQGDEAFMRAHDRALLRLTPSVLHMPSLDGVAPEDGYFEDNLSQALDSLQTEDRPDWMRIAAKSLLAKHGRIVKPHPLGGFVVVGKKRLGQFDPTFSEPGDSWVSSSDQGLLLSEHNRTVGEIAGMFAADCGLSEVLKLAGELHDIGKADPRFQALLRGGNRRAAEMATEMWAKSVGALPSVATRKAIRTRSGYPECGRHELHSVRLAENEERLRGDSAMRDLVLHLIASHHGWCRPFAPVIEDPTAESFEYVNEGRILRFIPDRNTLSGHGLERLDSGVAERFWRLTRRYGWWGLAWLESMLRLADWSASDSINGRNGHARRTDE